MSCMEEEIKMKKLRLLILTLLVFLFGFSNVNAMSLKPTGSGAGKRGDEVSIYITLSRSNSEKSVSGIDGTFSFDSNVFEFVSSSSLMGSGWTELSSVTNNSKFGYGNLTFNDLITSTSKNVAKVVLKVKNNASYGNSTISVNNPSATDENADDISISGGSLTFKVLSDINTLTNLTVDDTSIGFNEDTTSYDLTIDNDKAFIAAVKKDSSSKISGDLGEKSLKYGKNTFKVNVTSESGIVKTYTLNITRPDNRSKVNTLDNLELSEGKIKFNKDTLNYSVSVEYKVASIDIAATLTDDKSSFVSGYGPRKVVLQVGTNVIELRVKAENEEVKKYKLTVTRKADPNDVRSDNNYLSLLSLNEGTLNFSKDVFEYRVSVLNRVEKIEVTAKTEDTKATYEIDCPDKLIVGENTIKVTVKAENGSTRDYVVIVDRKEDNTELSSNTDILEFTIDGYEFYFNNNQYEYDLKIKDESSLVINYILDDPKSKVEISGNSELSNGSVINVKVIAEDGTEVVYKINILKDETNYALIYGAIALLVIILIIILAVVISNSKKRRKPSGGGNQSLPDMEYPRPQNIENMTYSGDIPIVSNPQVQQQVQSAQNVNNVQSQQPLQNTQPMQQQVVQNNNVNNNQNDNFF